MLRQRPFRRPSFISTKPSQATSLNTIIVSPAITPNQFNSDGDVDAWVGGKGDKGGDGGGKMIDYAEGKSRVIIWLMHMWCCMSSWSVIYNRVAQLKTHLRIVCVWRR